ncbi:MAG: outer membrane beta-barrel protein [Nevskiaceae bacterium]
MRRPLYCALALLAAPAMAADPAGYLEGSVGVALRDPSNEKPFNQLDLEYDTGTVLRFAAGQRYESGLMLRVDYGYTAYDELTASGSLTVSRDIEQHDARLGVFYATPRKVAAGYRFGAGYAWARENQDPQGGDSQAGGFLEAAAVLAGERVSWDLAVALMKLDGHDNYDAEAAELRAGAAFHRGRADVTVQLRYAIYQREAPFDEDVLEIRIGLGTGWNWPESAF